MVPFGHTSVPRAQIIDGQGGVLLPGLINDHCHHGILDDLTNLTRYGVTTAIGMACLSYDICNPLKNQTGLTSFITTGLAAIAPGSPHTMLFGTPSEDTIFVSRSGPSICSQHTRESFHIPQNGCRRGRTEPGHSQCVGVVHSQDWPCFNHSCYYDRHIQPGYHALN